MTRKERTLDIVREIVTDQLFSKGNSTGLYVPDAGPSYIYKGVIAKEIRDGELTVEDIENQFSTVLREKLFEDAVESPPKPVEPEIKQFQRDWNELQIGTYRRCIDINREDPEAIPEHMRHLGDQVSWFEIRNTDNEIVVHGYAENLPLARQVLHNAHTAKEDAERIARLECQLAGCLTAAEGHAVDDNDCEEGDWGWSPAFDVVKKLRTLAFSPFPNSDNYPCGEVWYENEAFIAVAKEVFGEEHIKGLIANKDLGSGLPREQGEGYYRVWGAGCKAMEAWMMRGVEDGDGADVASIGFDGVDSGEIGLALDVNGAKGTVYVSREMWRELERQWNEVDPPVTVNGMHVALVPSGELILTVTVNGHAVPIYITRETWRELERKWDEADPLVPSEPDDAQMLLRWSASVLGSRGATSDLHYHARCAGRVAKALMDRGPAPDVETPSYWRENPYFIAFLVEEFGDEWEEGPSVGLIARLYRAWCVPTKPDAKLPTESPIEEFKEIVSGVMTKATETAEIVTKAMTKASGADEKPTLKDELARFLEWLGTKGWSIGFATKRKSCGYTPSFLASFYLNHANLRPLLRPLMEQHSTNSAGPPTFVLHDFVELIRSHWDICDLENGKVCDILTHELVTGYLETWGSQPLHDWDAMVEQQLRYDEKVEALHDSPSTYPAFQRIVQKLHVEAFQPSTPVRDRMAAEIQSRIEALTNDGWTVWSVAGNYDYGFLLLGRKEVTEPL